MSAMEKISALFIISLLAIIYTEALPRKRVCVIGAGRAGLGVIKKVADQIDKFEPIAFERNSDVGGLWIYRDDSEKDEHGMYAHSGIYKNLRSVTYKDVMTYPDYTKIISKDGSTFISHNTFLEYMRNYTDNFQLRRYIQLDTYVTNVTPIKDNCNRGLTRWLLKKRNLNTNIEDEIICDGVIVCNGRYSKPFMPVIPGLHETFPGRILHSRNYRKPEDFANQTVVVLGAGASGLGITRDLSQYAKTVYLSHRGIYRNELPGNVKAVRGVVAANGSQLILQDKSTVTADAVIFCTGYAYNFPFLDESSGIKLADKRNLSPLIKRFINKIHPTMAFIGMNEDSAFVDIQYSEVEYFLKTLEKNKIRKESRKECTKLK